MNSDGTISWHGAGFWLSITTAVVLVGFGIGGILLTLRGPTGVTMAVAAGWNLFLGLLLFGVVISGNKRAPLIATIVAFLIAVRVVAGIAIASPVVGLLIDTALLLLVGLSAFDLQRQVKSGRFSGQKRLP